MTLDQAIELRRKQLSGEPVRALDLQEAIHVINGAQPSTGRRYKFRMPTLSRAEQERADGVLLFNLGVALGRRLA